MKISTKREQWAETFERAAENIEMGMDRFCCCAISNVSKCVDRRLCPKLDVFRSLFYPKHPDEYVFFGDDFVQTNQRARVTALLFAAAMARAGAMDSFLKKGGKRA